MYKHILLTTDGSELALRAMNDGIALAKEIGARVTAITVIRPWHTIVPVEVMIPMPEDDYLKAAQTQAKLNLKKATQAATEAGIACDIFQVVHKEPWQAITKAAKDNGCDLIVMGSHGRSGLAKLILGSETQKVLTHSTIPVLVHR